MPFKPGHTKTGGRAAGTPNKATTAVKGALLASLHDMGGRQWFNKLAEEHPPAYAALIGKLIPNELKLEGSSDAPLLVLRDYTGRHKPASPEDEAIDVTPTRSQLEPQAQAHSNSTATSKPVQSEARAWVQQDTDADLLKK